MTKSSKEQKKPLNNKLRDPSHDETLGEGVSVAEGIFKPQFLKYALLISLVGCGLIYLAPNLNFDLRSNLNKFEAFWYNVLNLTSNTEMITGEPKSKNNDSIVLANERTDFDRKDLSKNIPSHLNENIKGLRKRIDSLEAQFVVFDQTNSNYASRDTPPTDNNFVQLQELVKTQEQSGTTLTKLTSRIVTLEGAGIDKSLNMKEIRDELSRQQDRISIISDRLTSAIDGLDQQNWGDKQSSLRSPVLIFSLSHLLTAIRQEKPFRVQLEAFRLSIGDKLDAKKYINQLEKYAPKGIPNSRSLLKRLVFMGGNLQIQEDQITSGFIHGALMELRSLVKIRKLKGSDDKSIPKSIDAAIEALQNNNLKLAINHINQLELGSINGLKVWLDGAKSLSNLEVIIPKLESVVLSKSLKSE